MQFPGRGAYFCQIGFCVGVFCRKNSFASLYEWRHALAPALGKTIFGNGKLNIWQQFISLFGVVLQAAGKAALVRGVGQP